MTNKYNQLRLVRIAKYLGDNEFYDEAYSIKKMATEGVDVENAMISLDDPKIEKDPEIKNKILSSIDRIKHMVRTGLDVLINTYMTASGIKFAPFVVDLLSIFLAVCDDSIDLTKRAIIAIAALAMIPGGEGLLAVLSALIPPLAPVIWIGGNAILLKIIIGVSKMIVTEEHRKKARMMIRKDKSLWSSYGEFLTSYWADEGDMRRFEETQPGSIDPSNRPRENSTEREIAEEFRNQGLIPDKNNKLTDKQVIDVAVAKTINGLEKKISRILYHDDRILKHSYSY